MRLAARALLLAIPSLAVATARDALAYRPFDGTDAAVADTGEFELELGPVHYLGSPHAHYLLAPATVLNLGLVRDVELVVDFSNVVGLDRVPGEARDRLLDSDVLLKFVLRRGFLQDEDGVSVALELGPLTPNVQRENGFGASADLIVSWSWQGMTFHLNDWGELSRSDLYPSWFTGLIVEGPEASKVRPVVEVFGEHDFAPGTPTTVSGLAGAIWQYRDALAFDLGLRAARTAGEPVAEVRLGFTWAVPVWTPKGKVRD